MKKQFLLEGEQITLKRAKELFGEDRYMRIMEDAKTTFLADPLTELSYMTRDGILMIWFQVT